MPYVDREDIDTLTELASCVQDVKTAGYDVEFDIHPREDKGRAGDGFFLIVAVTTNYPEGSGIEGEWWFDADYIVMQVL